MPQGRDEVSVLHVSRIGAGPGRVRRLHLAACDRRDKPGAGFGSDRLWLSQIESGAVRNITEIAIREDCSPRHVNMTISLAFLAPSLVRAAVEGRLPHGIGLARLIDAPAEWDRQYRMLGLAS